MTELTPSDEPFISPAVARWWMLEINQAHEIDGLLMPNGDVPHFGSALIVIANGSEPRQLSEAYMYFTNHRGQLSNKVLADYGAEIIRAKGLSDSNID